MKGAIKKRIQCCYLYWVCSLWIPSIGGDLSGWCSGEIKPGWAGVSLPVLERGPGCADILVSWSCPSSGLASPTVFFDISSHGLQALGPHLLWAVCDRVPRTAEKPWHCGCWRERIWLWGSCLHRVIPGFMPPCGDFSCHNGAGGKFTYRQKHAYENFTLKYTDPGLWVLTNAGLNTNGS